MRASIKRRSLRVEQLESRLVLSTFVVAPTGSDSAAGTASAPWKTLQYAAASVRAGDTVQVRAGNYVGFDLRSSGTATAPISFEADSGVVINTRNPVTNDGINLEGASYVNIQGFQVVGMPRAGIRSVINNHVTIRNNIADQNRSWGIFTGFSEDLLIEGNTTSRSVVEHGIYVSNSADRPVIRNNVSWGNAASGIHMNGDISQGGDGIISGAVVEGNTIRDNGVRGGSGINCDGVQGALIRNNLLYNNHASGISLFQIDGGGPSSGNLVTNNTVVVASDGRWALNIQQAATGNTARNNILYNNGSFRGSLDISPDSLPGFTSDYNVVIDRFTTDGGSSRMTLAQWRASSGQDVHSLIATPAALFVAPANNDYHLSASSPAVDSGTSQGAPATDLDGAPRPSGIGYDIGAYELQKTTSAFVVDAGFESVAMGNGYVYNPAGSAWNFSGSSGLSGNNSGFTVRNPVAPGGTQVAFLQVTGSISQTITGWAAGNYVVSFDAAKRGGFGGDQDFRVLVDGVSVGIFAPTSTSYQSYRTLSFAVGAGSHTLTFQGLNTAGGDNTAFLDNIAIAAAPTPPPVVAPTVADAGFESVAMGNGYAYNPAGSAWNFSGSSGLSGNNSGFTVRNPVAPGGTQVAFLQVTGSISQTITGWAAGNYVVSFDAAKRGGFGGDQDFRVLVDGVSVGIFAPTSTSYQSYRTLSFAVGAGSHTLTFQGLNTAGGDNTAFLDNIAIAAAT